MHEIRKILITGGSGSGKTRLGQQLAALLGIPVVSLDEITYDFSKTSRFIHKRTLAQRKQLLKEAMASRRWIIEGGYYTVFPEPYTQCDLLIYLRPSITQRLWNTMKRFLIRSLRGEYEGLWNYLSLTWYNLHSMKKWQRERYNLLKQRYGRKFHAFRSADEAYDWFARE